MIIWINGTFGAGKTTTTKELVEQLPDAAIFDTEFVGYMLRPPLANREPVENFQERPLWRSLVVEVARRLLDYTKVPLVVPQTVLVEQYFTEVAEGFAQHGIPVHHFCLHTDRATLVERIKNDDIEHGALQWRLDYLDRYEEARSWLANAATTIDTTRKTPSAVTQEIQSHLKVG